MAKSEIARSFQALSKKIDSLILENTSLRSRIDTLSLQNEELLGQHAQDQKALEKANKEIEYLSLSHRLASSPEALVEARKEISRLIRTIDSCIRLIKED